MASKRTIKKALNGMIIDVLDECLSLQLYNEAKTEETDKLIDEALDYANDTLSKIHQAKSKRDYPAIRQEMENKGVYFIQELNALQ